jgi:ABC-2 type transport system ATP-binding protein
MLRIPPNPDRPSTSLVSLRAVGKSFGRREVLRRLDLEIGPGCTAVVGENGAGKSTLLRLLAGLLSFAGEAEVLGRDPRNERMWLQRSIGYLADDGPAFPGLSNVETCLQAGRLSGLDRLTALARAHSALDEVGIAAERYAPFDSSPPGVQQLVRLAQVTVHRPRLLLLDEPTAAVDPRSRRAVLSGMGAWIAKKEGAIIMTTHHMTDLEVCDRVVFLEGGQVMRSVSGGAAAQSHAGRYRVTIKQRPAELAGQLRLAGDLVEEHGLCLLVTLPAHRTPRDILRAAVATGAGIRQLAWRPGIAP